MKLQKDIHAGNRQEATIIIFGATGDLMKKKIAPALYTQYTQKGEVYAEIIATGRSAYTTKTYRVYLAHELASFFSIAEDALDQHFLSSVTYVQGDVKEETYTGGLYETLARAVHTPQVVLYLSLGCDAYPYVARGVATSGLAKKNVTEHEWAAGAGSWCRAIVEKPHGYDAATMHDAVDPLVATLGTKNVRLIEHYFAKDAVQSIFDFRFRPHALYEGVWGSAHIARIDVTLNETLGLETRGAFYEAVGALRDMGQNHCLQLLTVLCMGKPTATDGDPSQSTYSPAAIHEARAAFLDILPVYTAHEAAERLARFQYEGYRTHPHVAPNSEVETAFSLSYTLTGDRWGGAKVHIQSGKRLADNDKHCTVFFKPGTHDPVFTERELVSVTFYISPSPKREIHTRDAAGHTYTETENVHTAASAQYVGEYVRILDEVFKEESAYFVTPHEVALMWRAIDPFTEVCIKNTAPLRHYAPGSDPFDVV